MDEVKELHLVPCRKAAVLELVIMSLSLFIVLLFLIILGSGFLTLFLSSSLILTLIALVFVGVGVFVGIMWVSFNTNLNSTKYIVTKDKVEIQEGYKSGKHCTYNMKGYVNMQVDYPGLDRFLDCGRLTINFMENESIKLSKIENPLEVMGKIEEIILEGSNQTLLSRTL